MRGSITAVLSPVGLGAGCSQADSTGISAPTTITASAESSTKTVTKTVEKTVTKTSTKTTVQKAEPTVEQAVIDDGLVEVEYTVTGSTDAMVHVRYNDENGNFQLAYPDELPFRKVIRMTPEAASSTLLDVTVLRPEQGDKLTCTTAFDKEIVTMATQTVTDGIVMLWCEEGVFDDNGEVTYKR